ncbi:MAG: carboxypeptidase-like regulatory domain-containing protein, partial [Bacteroidota bacterium]
MKKLLLIFKNYLLIFLFAMASVYVSAQSTISGQVTDEDGNPLIGATVQVISSGKGTVTNINGEYSIMASENDVLECSYLGYDSFTAAVSSQKTINFTLVESGVGLEEVTVSARRVEENLQEVPIAVSSFSLEEIKSKGLNSITDVADFAPNVEMENTAPISGASSALV